MNQPQPPLLGELENYLKWEWENGLTGIELPPFVPPEIHNEPSPVAIEKPLSAELLPEKTLAPGKPPEKGSHQGSVLPRLHIPVPVAPPAAVLSTGDDNVAKAMAKLRHDWVGCERCILCRTRHNFVFGEGNLHPRLLFVGEGPGENEDKQGRPFVGKAGALLTNLIKAMGLRREAVFITNIVKCRPPNNRDPLPEEVSACNHLLTQQIELLKPEVMVALGKPAAHLLLNCQEPISRLRGHWYDYQGIPLLPTFHPAYLLRNPKDKGLIWSDMCQVLQKLNLPVPVLGRKSPS